LHDDERRVELALDALDQRAEGLGLALRDTGGRLVQTHDARRDREHRRELHDAARSRRQLDDETVGVAAEAQEVDQLRGFGSPGIAWNSTLSTATSPPKSTANALVPIALPSAFVATVTPARRASETGGVVTVFVGRSGSRCSSQRRIMPRNA